MKTFVITVLCTITFTALCAVSSVAARECVDGENCVVLQNPLGDVNDVPTLVGNIIGAVLGIVGSITLFVFLDGAFQWLTSAGNSDKVQSGMKTMLFATLGLFVIFASYAILQAIISTIVGT